MGMIRPHKKHPSLQHFSKPQLVPVAFFTGDACSLSDLADVAPGSHLMVVPIFVKVVAAVETVHRAQLRISHPDPHEIVIQSDGKVSISPRERHFEGMTLAVASFKYTAPELLLQSAETVMPAAADSYALGMMFYEILLGRHLFQQQFAETSRRGELGWMQWHTDQSRRAKPLHELLEVFPPALSRLIEAMMEKDVAKRNIELAEIAETLSDSLKTTAVLSGLSALRGEAQKHGTQRMALRRPLPALGSGWTAALENQVRSGLSRRSAAANARAARNQQTPDGSRVRNTDPT